MIHAGRTIDLEGIEIIGGLDPTLVQDPPTGVILGVVELVDCVRFNPTRRYLPGLGVRDNYGLLGDPLATGPVCWVLQNAGQLAEPIPSRGQRGLWEVDLDALVRDP